MNNFYNPIRNFLLSTFILWSLLGISEQSKAVSSLPLQPKKGKKNAKLAAAFNTKGNSYFNKAVKNRAFLDSAIVYYKKAIKKAPKDPGLKFNLGIAYFAKNKNNKAVSQFKKGFNLCKKNQQRAFQLLRINYKTQQKDNTMADLVECLKQSFSTKKEKGKSKKKGKSTRRGGPKSVNAQSKKKKSTRRGGPKSVKVLTNHLYKKSA